MATAPFEILEAKPADADIVAQHPADERAMRDIVESALAIEHGLGGASVSKGARHKFGVGSTATRDAITTWEVGSIWMNTATSPVTIQRTVSIDPDVWEDVTISGSGASIDTNVVAAIWLHGGVA